MTPLAGGQVFRASVTGTARSFPSFPALFQVRMQTSTPSEEAQQVDPVAENFSQFPATIQRMLSLENACQMEKNKFAIRNAIKDYRLHESDTGSPEVQVAILTERIKYLTSHVQVHRKDKHNARGLTQMVNDRKSLLKYLRRESEERYRALITRLGIRDAINLNPQRVFLPTDIAKKAAERVRRKLDLAKAKVVAAAGGGAVSKKKRKGRK
ncbi:hypothetical protein GUITHDRAFT_154369 [Guillardia theta CCMP2712]|uniref:30S ribosomal protein S15 n=1 Tax=Guillardia theta (strain CCMP2712) TaxID=905079 RepID=L1IUL1_GUITC|nr:hypothetical protein GUITHDRAFT_154369 [Guillardia theta CCMP2712]EKX39535.1 hypothetical protein GUITHDRAFT_154369 [Guillardia theta CCMP2712]|eukprot:XP_005826515.1 hypothetical protein GUITHDRAFT_154369 [Guillardia theta CCMP2712]